MTTGYSSITVEQAKREVAAMRKFTRSLNRKRAIELLVGAGILEKNGKRLTRRYR